MALRRLFKRSPSAPRIFPTTGFTALDGSVRLEEESWEWYKPGLFYPVRIGQVFKSQYQVLGKLGYGSRSTAWLCRDLTEHRYVTMKVCEQSSPPVHRELAAYSHLDTITTTNPGALLVRTALDAFKIVPESDSAEHQCFVHEPLGMNMEVFTRLHSGRKLPEHLLKVFVTHLLQALDFLHTDAKMIHGDLQSRNVHLRIEDESILKDFEQSEINDPGPRKIDGGRIIYQSRELKMPKKLGRPILCDFGEARFGESTYTDDIQPYVYRAPEVILGIPWTYSVDIWNIGVLIWDVFEGKHMFTAKNRENGESLSLYHLAEMVAVMGSPPVDYLARSTDKTPKDYFNDAGNWNRTDEAPIPADMSLEASEERLQGESKVLFLQFIRKIIRWEPEKRYTAKELLKDPWLTGK